MRKERNPLIGGLFLLGLGLIALLNQLFDLPLLGNLAIYLLAGLGVIFLLWGVATREAGLMIPGGILSGLGLGVVLISRNSFGSEEASGAVMMLSFAFGWLLITLFTAVFTDETHWWPLIPGAIMALIAAALLFEGPYVVALEWLSKLWPLFLIAAGLAVLFGARRDKKNRAAPLSEEDLKALEKKAG